MIFDGLPLAIFSTWSFKVNGWLSTKQRHCTTFTHGYLQSHLASIHSLEEHTFVVNLCKYASNGTFTHGGYWIGLNDQMENGVHRWTDGSKVNFYRWKPDQPNNKYGEQCCVKVSSSEWNDVRCWNKIVKHNMFVNQRPNTIRFLKDKIKGYNGTCHFFGDRFMFFVYFSSIFS